MSGESKVVVIGTFDTKGAEHFFLKESIESRGMTALTIHVGTAGPSPFQADYDLYAELLAESPEKMSSRDLAIDAMLTRADRLIRELFSKGRICGLISAGGGTGTYLATRIMRGLPLGVPKVMVSTVASRDMSGTVGTRDITMIHSVADLLGVNSITGRILDRAAGAVCGMAGSTWSPPAVQRRIALTMFGFITEAAENIKSLLEDKGLEVVAFHANGTGGMAMEELAAEGYFDGILDLATHELADQLKGGYCRGIGPGRLEPVPGRVVPRLGGAGGAGLRGAGVHPVLDPGGVPAAQDLLLRFPLGRALEPRGDRRACPPACRKAQPQRGFDGGAGSDGGMVGGGSLRRAAPRSGDARRVSVPLLSSRPGLPRTGEDRGHAHQRYRLCRRAADAMEEMLGKTGARNEGRRVSSELGGGRRK